jgi:hypothetical protein
MLIRALIALPGIVAGIAPPLIAYFDPWHKNQWAPGIIVIFK